MFKANNAVDSNPSWTTTCFLIIVYVPSLIPALAFMTPLRSQQSSNPKKTPRFLRRLHLCIVTRGTNVETVIRCCDQMRHLQQLDSRIRITIVTDEPNDAHFRGTGVNIIAVPKAFSPSKALYKARALEWFRVQMNLNDDDWVLHLDEESVVDEHAIQTCIDFAENQTDYDYGQGAIIYNAHEYWNHALSAIGDVSRSRDDYAKFYLAHNYLHVPIFGVHGSFLLIRGKVENSVGWDTDSLVEDFWFGLQAWGKGFKGGWLPSLAREQSPKNVQDFCKQRRRWLSGMMNLPGIAGKISAALWVISSVGIPIISLAWHFDLVHIPYWIYITGIACQASEMYTLYFSCVVQDLDAGLSIWKVIFHVVLYSVTCRIPALMEAATVIYTLLKPATGFYVVSK